MATATKTTRTESETVTKDVPVYQLTLTEDEAKILRNLCADGRIEGTVGKDWATKVWVALRNAEVPIRFYKYSVAGNSAESGKARLIING